jgi:2-iminobutanoate/2-iminopropanoate deaminase
LYSIWKAFDMKSVLNAAARRNMNTMRENMGQEALERAAQALRLRSEDAPKPPGLKQALALPPALPSSADTAVSLSHACQASAEHLTAKRVGNMLYMSGVIAIDPMAKQVITSYQELPAHAREELRKLGYDTGQHHVDVFEAPIVAQSWFVLARIREIAQLHGAQMSDVFKLVQYFRDLRHYPAYHRVRQLFCPAGVVSTVVEVSGMLPSSQVLVEVEATALLA